MSDMKLFWSRVLASSWYVRILSQFHLDCSEGLWLSRWQTPDQKMQQSRQSQSVFVIIRLNSSRRRVSGILSSSVTWFCIVCVTGLVPKVEIDRINENIARTIIAQHRSIGWTQVLPLHYHGEWLIRLCGIRYLEHTHWNPGKVNQNEIREKTFSVKRQLVKNLDDCL